LNDPAIPSQLPLIRHLSLSQQRDVLGAGHDKTLAKGVVLFHEQDPADAMYAVVTGQMKLVRYSPGGKEMLLHLVRPGQTFAEAALFGSGTYPATAVALTETRLWCLPRQRLEELIRRSPELGLALVGSISVWTRKLAAQLELLTQRRVEERLAVYVIGRARGQDLQAGASVALTEPKHLIAAQCGTAPEVLSRTFRRLEEEGILEVEGDTLRILDVERLQALAEWIDDVE
jgi:CRP/FNR family transcriptional regulator